MGNKLTIFFGVCAILFMLYGVFSPTVEVRTMAILLTTVFSIMAFYSAEQYVRQSISQQIENALKKEHKVE